VKRSRSVWHAGVIVNHATMQADPAPSNFAGRRVSQTAAKIQQRLQKQRYRQSAVPLFSIIHSDKY